MKINYGVLKHVTVLLQVLSIPLGVYSGAMLAMGNPGSFIVGAVASMGFTFIQAHLWWLTMEKIKHGDI